METANLKGIQVQDISEHKIEEREPSKPKDPPKKQPRRYIENRAETRKKLREQRKKDRKFNSLSRQFEKATREGDQKEIERIGAELKKLNGK